MFYSKKGQFIIISVLLLILVLIFTYYQETDNSYIVKSSKYNLLDNIIYETCLVGRNSNGTYIQVRFDSFTNNVSSYCLDSGYVCNLTIQNNSIIPSNESLINYTLFDYHIEYNASGYVYSGDFNC